MNPGRRGSSLRRGDEQAGRRKDTLRDANDRGKGKDKPVSRYTSRCFYRRGIERLGWTAVWIVDEHGCLMHTEPVCTVPVGTTGHPAFLDMVEGLDAGWWPSLLTHHSTEVIHLEADK